MANTGAVSLLGLDAASVATRASSSVPSTRNAVLRTSLGVASRSRISSAFWGPSRFQAPAAAAPFGHGNQQSLDVHKAKLGPIRAIQGGRGSSDGPGSPGRTKEFLPPSSSGAAGYESDDGSSRMSSFINFLIRGKASPSATAEAAADEESTELEAEDAAASPSVGVGKQHFKGAVLGAETEAAEKGLEESPKAAEGVKLAEEERERDVSKTRENPLASKAAVGFQSKAVREPAAGETAKKPGLRIEVEHAVAGQGGEDSAAKITFQAAVAEGKRPFVSGSKVDKGLVLSREDAEIERRVVLKGEKKGEEEVPKEEEKREEEANLAAVAVEDATPSTGAAEPPSGLPVGLPEKDEEEEELRARERQVAERLLAIQLAADRIDATLEDEFLKSTGAGRIEVEDENDAIKLVSAEDVSLEALKEAEEALKSVEEALKEVDEAVELTEQILNVPAVVAEVALEVSEVAEIPEVVAEVTESVAEAGEVTEEVAPEVVEETEATGVEVEKKREKEQPVVAVAEPVVVIDEAARRLAAERRAERLKKLQEEHEFITAKMFFYPEAPKAGESVDVFFHRPASVLRDRPGIFLNGAFNNWQWQQVKVELKPSSELSNDWWACSVELPAEAYEMNFVFHSSDNVFENNEQADFFISVQSEWDAEKFETMLNEVKREEAERKAAEEAERQRIAAEEKLRAKQRAEEEQDLNAARNEANHKRGWLLDSKKKLPKEMPGLWRTEPTELVAGQPVKIVYNRKGRAVQHSQHVWLHVGINNWENKAQISAEMKFATDVDGDWWQAEIVIPSDALILNWVVADGPPGKAGAYDNNNRQDFGAPVGDSAWDEAFFEGIEGRILERLKRERREREAIEAEKAAKRAEFKAAMKARTKETFFKSQAHVFYTEPAEPQAGEEVTVYYNPNNTLLHGREKVWMRGSFNRWTHRAGLFLPIEMTSAPNGTHVMAKVKVPIDAYIMDLVFLDSFDPENATYDSRGGLDYHVPVVGGSVREPPLSIIHVALEMAPVAKVGGLGDVVTSLSRAVIELGHDVEVVLPKYDCLKYNNIQDIHETGHFEFGGTRWRCWFGFVEGIGVHFLEPESGIFWVGCIYGRRDDAARFGTFCHAALEFLLQTGRRPDILHCHDWSSAPVAWLYKEQYSHYGLNNARTVFTIHNLEFGQALIGRAMAACDKATTVSPTYAAEISRHGAVSAHLGKFYGIVNGIDPDIWDPLGDNFIPIQYGSENVVQGKWAAKQELWRRANLAHDNRPLVGIVSRLTNQKGIHLIKHAIWRTIDRGGHVVLLGSAPDPRVQADFEGLAQKLAQNNNNMARLFLSYDEPLSHLIYAGADIILVPSIFEPCGLTQLIAMRYGAVPVVRKTGGLNDTVFDVDHDQDRARNAGKEVNGFSFEGTDNGGVDYALNRAITAWYEGRDWWNKLAKSNMEQDWTWNRPALDYLELYHGARKY